MKNLQAIRYATLLLGVILIFGSCKKDPCEGVNCLHGVCNDGTCYCETGWEGEFCTEVADPCTDVPCVNGDCVNGICNCDAGWTGAACDSVDTHNFADLYNLYETCNPTGNAGPYAVSITQVNDQVVFYGLWEEGAASANGTVTGNTLSIPYQSYSGSYNISGDANYNASQNVVSITYTVFSSSGTQLDQCSGTMTPQ